MNSTIKDGGPAFPGKRKIVTRQESYGNPELSYLEDVSGMTLRDYFAALAMQGIAAFPEQGSAIRCDQWNHELIAKGAYMMADAMLKARQ